MVTPEDGNDDETRQDEEALLERAKARHKQSKLEVDHSSLLEETNRAKLYEQLDKTPGLNISLAGERAGIPSSTAAYHIRCLEAVGIITIVPSIEKDHEKICFLQKDDHLYEDEKTRILYGGGTTRRIARYIAENPGATIENVADAFDKSYSAIYTQAMLLKEKDLVERRKGGRSYRYEPTFKLLAWDEEIGTHFPPPPPRERDQEEKAP